MKKKSSAIILAICMAVTLLPISAVAESGSEYFTDIPSDAWYAQYIDICYESGLMNGVGDGRFDPDGIVTNMQMMTVCLRIHFLLNGGSGDLTDFYQNTLDYVIFFTDESGEKVADYGDISDWFEKFNMSSGNPPVLTFSEEAWGRLRYANDPIDSLTLYVFSTDFNERYGVKKHEFVYMYEGDNAGNYAAVQSDPVDWFGDILEMALVLGATQSLRENNRTWEAATVWYLAINAPVFVEKDSEAREEMEALLMPLLSEMPSGADDPCLRIHLAYYLAMYTPEEYLQPIHNVKEIQDLNAELVRRLYNAGIIGGVDDKGTFDGPGTLTRAQLAAIIARVVEPELRLG